MNNERVFTRPYFTLTEGSQKSSPCSSHRIPTLLSGFSSSTNIKSIKTERSRRQTEVEIFALGCFQPSCSPPLPRMDDQMVRPNECAMISRGLLMCKLHV